MDTNLKKELKILAERILGAQLEEDLDSLLNQSREIYEKLLVLHHMEKDQLENGQGLKEKVETDPVPYASFFSEKGDDSASTPEEQETENISATGADVMHNEATEEPEAAEEEDAPLSLSDLFVPTFEEIKEDMSQKEEFKDTISLDETENLFETKKETSRQLSLNDKLVGSSLQVGLNDRIAFVNKLFNFSQADFNKVLAQLNECSTKAEALNYFQYQVKPNYNWKGKEDREERFVEIIERKFL
jgi:hypothetical protein